MTKAAQDPGRRVRRRGGLRALLAALALLVLAPVAAGIALATLFQPASLVPRIEAALQRATGREAHIGSVRISWSLAPALVVDGLTLANAPGGSEPAMLDVPQAEVRVALLPLLSRRVELSRVLLTRPRLLLETDAAGRGNWLFSRPASEGTAGTPAAAPSARLAPELRQIELRDATLRLRDGRAGRSLDVALSRMLLEDTGGEARLSGTAQAAGVTLGLQGKAGPLSRLLARSGAEPGAGPGEAPWPFVLDAAGDGLHLLAMGALPAAPSLAGAHVTLGAHAADLSAILPSLPLHDADLAMEWGADGPSNIRLKSGAMDLSSVAPGLALNQASLAASALDQPATIDAAGSLDGAPITFSATILPRRDAQGGATGGVQAVALRGLRLAGPFGDVAGDAALTWAPRLALRGTLISQRLDLDALRKARIGPPTDIRPSAPPAAGPLPPAAAPDRLIPDAALPFELLLRADADLRWSASAVHVGGQDWQGVETHAVLAAGRLRLDPVEATVPGGRLRAVLQADAGQPEPSVGLKLALPSIALAPVAAALGRGDALSGTGQGEADLRASGQTARALAASLDGTASLTVVDGELDVQGAFPALVGLLRSAGIPAALRGRSPVRCLALSVAAQHGAVQLRTGYLDASRLRLTAEGSVNLGDEALALRLRPALRLGPTETTVPLRLEGSFARPRTQLDEIAPGRVGAVIGGQHPQADECGPALLAARGGRDGPMPAPEARPAPSSPADVLRRLLR